MTFVAGSPLTAGQLNIYLNANLSELAPAKATTAGNIFTPVGANSIAERAVGNEYIGTTESTISGSYADLATVGPTVTLTTGTQALIGHGALVYGGSNSAQVYMSFAVSGATTNAATDVRAMIHFEPNPGGSGAFTRMGTITYLTGLTAGVNTFRAKYRTFTGVETGTWLNRFLWVVAL